MVLPYGSKFVDTVADFLDCRLRGRASLSSNEFKFIILHSFSWFEISVVFFLNDPQSIPDLLAFREFSIRDVRNHSICERCRGFRDFDSEHDDESIFIDSLTYFGVKEDLIMDESHDSLDEITLDTQIEWQIKPGHAKELQEYLKDTHINFDFKNQRLLLGRSDHLFPESEPHKFANNIQLLRKFENGNPTAKKYLNLSAFKGLQNIYTRVSFNIPTIAPTNEDGAHDNIITGGKQRIILACQKTETRISKCYSGKIKDLAGSIDLKGIDRCLKSMKISRQTKEMMLKVILSGVSGL